MSPPPWGIVVNGPKNDMQAWSPKTSLVGLITVNTGDLLCTKQALHKWSCVLIHLVMKYCYCPPRYIWGSRGSPRVTQPSGRTGIWTWTVYSTTHTANPRPHHLSNEPIPPLLSWVLQLLKKMDHLYWQRNSLRNPQRPYKINAG